MASAYQPCNHTLYSPNPNATIRRIEALRKLSRLAAPFDFAAKRLSVDPEVLDAYVPPGRFKFKALQGAINNSATPIDCKESYPGVVRAGQKIDNCGNSAVTLGAFVKGPAGKIFILTVDHAVKSSVFVDRRVVGDSEEQILGGLSASPPIDSSIYSVASTVEPCPVPICGGEAPISDYATLDFRAEINVKKCGEDSHETSGIVRECAHLDCVVVDVEGANVTFYDQFLIERADNGRDCNLTTMTPKGMFACDGDSGSIVFKSDGGKSVALGILIAKNEDNEGLYVASPIKPIFDALGSKYSFLTDTGKCAK